MRERESGLTNQMHVLINPKSRANLYLSLLDQEIYSQEKDVYYLSVEIFTKCRNRKILYNLIRLLIGLLVSLNSISILFVNYSELLKLLLLLNESTVCVKS